MTTDDAIDARTRKSGGIATKAQFPGDLVPAAENPDTDVRLAERSSTGDHETTRRSAGRVINSRRTISGKDPVISTAAAMVPITATTIDRVTTTTGLHGMLVLTI